MRTGFAPYNALFGNFENNKSFKQRAAEDKKYRVNYFDCQEEYSKNVALIAHKYNIDMANSGSRKIHGFAQNAKQFKKSGYPTQTKINKKDSDRN